MKFEEREDELQISCMTERFLIESEWRTDPENKEMTREDAVEFVNRCLVELPKIDSLEKESYNRFCGYQEELSIKTIELNKSPSNQELMEIVAELSESERKASLFHDKLFNNYEDLKRGLFELVIKYNLKVS